MTAITSRHHPIVKQFRAAARGDGAILLDGWHLLTDAAAAGLAVQTVAISGPLSGDAHTLVSRLGVNGAQVFEVSASVLKALSPVDSPTGVVALAQPPSVPPESLLSPPPALVLAGIGIQDPGNAGAMIRSAAAAGATGVLVDETTADPWGWKALRASMGSTFHIPVVRSRTPIAALQDWRARRITVVAAVPRGGTPIYALDMTRPLVVLMGGEGPGLPPDALAVADEFVTIPMTGAIESLNVAAAAAVLLYEARRQRAR